MTYLTPGQCTQKTCFVSGRLEKHTELEWMISKNVKQQSHSNMLGICRIRMTIFSAYVIPPSIVT